MIGAPSHPFLPTREANKSPGWTSRVAKVGMPKVFRESVVSILESATSKQIGNGETEHVIERLISRQQRTVSGICSLTGLRLAFIPSYVCGHGTNPANTRYEDFAILSPTRALPRTVRVTRTPGKAL